jgi:hypothetical protein
MQTSERFDVLLAKHNTEFNPDGLSAAVKREQRPWPQLPLTSEYHIVAFDTEVFCFSNGGTGHEAATFAGGRT